MLDIANSKKKILISAYAISPYLGSEYGVGWNFVSRLSAFYDVTVLYGTSGERMGNNTEILDYIKNNSPAGVDYVYVDPNSIVAFFDWLNRKINPIFFSLAYLLWQRQVLQVARTLTKKSNFDLVHQLNTIGFRNPGLLWQLGIPFVWGPVGGTSNLNCIFFPLLSTNNYLRHKIRNLSNRYFLSHSSRIKKATRAASAIFCATQMDQSNFKKFLKIDCSVIRENSIINNVSVIKQAKVPLKFIWVGRLDELKAPYLLIEAVAKLGQLDAWTLHVVGDGPVKEKCMAMSRQMGIDAQIVWHGNVRREQVLEIMRDADVNIYTSLMDSNPTVLLEAFEMCVPTIALDHFGMGDLIDASTGFKIKITSLDNIIFQITEFLRFCVANPNKLNDMKTKIMEKQRVLHWNATIQNTREIYEQVLIND